MSVYHPILFTLFLKKDTWQEVIFLNHKIKWVVLNIHKLLETSILSYWGCHCRAEQSVYPKQQGCSVSLVLETRDLNQSTKMFSSFWILRRKSCSMPAFLTYRWLSSLSLHSTLCVYLSKYLYLFLRGYQAHWIRIPY